MNHLEKKCLIHPTGFWLLCTSTVVTVRIFLVLWVVPWVSLPFSGGLSGEENAVMMLPFLLLPSAGITLKLRSRIVAS